MGRRAWWGLLALLVVAACAGHRPEPLTAADRDASLRDTSLGRVRVGMTTEEVLAIAGPPTGYSAHNTPRVWIPFAVFFGDTSRATYYYRGRGRVIFSNASPFTFRVIDIQADPTDLGDEAKTP